jgi:hypothetical protein
MLLQLKNRDLGVTKGNIMKSLLVSTLFLLSSQTMAQFNFPDLGDMINLGGKKTVISEKVVTLPVDISTAKLKWTNLGYGNTYFVKVILNEMAGVTILNHRNEGEDGPCLFTYDTTQLEDVVQGNPAVIKSDLKITLVKNNYVHNNVCKSALTENIETTIRGFKFQHSKSIALPDRVAEDCI